jgi:hypothetical protein
MQLIRLREGKSNARPSLNDCIEQAVWVLRWPFDGLISQLDAGRQVDADRAAITGTKSVKHGDSAVTLTSTQYRHGSASYRSSDADMTF